MKMKLVALSFFCCFSSFAVEAANWDFWFQTQHAFSGMVVFGDSLSDTGNLYKAAECILPISPPHYEGRFSNGPVWVETLSRLLALKPGSLSVYAYGGARTAAPFNMPIPDLQKQVEQYQADTQRADPNTLHVIWIGANDFLEELEMIPEDELSGYIAQSVSNIEKAVHTLARMGAKKFLVLNLPDLVRTPYVLDGDKERGDKVYSKGYGRISVEFNKLFAERMNQLSWFESLEIIQLDIYQLLNDLIRAPDRYQLENVKNRCNENELTENEKPICMQPDKFLFWDAVHPTVKAHEHLAIHAFNLLKSHGYQPAPLMNTLLADDESPDLGSAKGACAPISPQVLQAIKAF